MNSKSSQRQTVPSVVLYKKALDEKSAQAAWYDQSVEATAKVFGERQGLTVINVGPDQAERVRAVLTEGAAADKGTLTLPAVKPEDLSSLLAALAVAPTSTQTAPAKPPLGQAPQPVGSPSAAPAEFPPLDPLWAALTVNMVVLAPELSDEGVPEGWWEAVITAIKGDMLTLRFRDYPEPAPVRRKREQLAIMYPPPVRV